MLKVATDDVSSLIVKAAELWRANDDDAIVTIRRYWEIGDVLLQIKSRIEMSARWTEWLAEHEAELGFSKKKGLRCLQLRRENRTLASKISAEDAQAMLCTFWGHVVVRGTAGTGENEWFTPPKYIELARKVLGEIDLDPASNKLAQRFVKAGKFYTKEDDGLQKGWKGRVWLNPPYAQPLISHFVEKLRREVGAKNVTAAILLTHNYTDTEWFQNAMRTAKAVCFTSGRVRFESPEGEVAAPTQGQAFTYFGSDASKFVEAFFDVGFVLVHP